MSEFIDFAHLTIEECHEQMAKRLMEFERIIHRQAVEGINLHAQVATLQAEVHYWRERALHCAELEPEGT
jgi:hypothetical protein